MRFRLKAFAWHLFGSAGGLSVTLGLMYLGWYHWPGWYLADMPTVLAIMVGIDVVLGPLLTFIIADPAKARRVLVRDLGCILLVQSPSWRPHTNIAPHMRTGRMSMPRRHPEYTKISA